MDHGHDKKEAANMFGVSEATIVNMLAVLEAPKVIRSAAGRWENLERGRLQARQDQARGGEEEARGAPRACARTPGRKRSKNAQRARRVMGRPEPAWPGLGLAGVLRSLGRRASRRWRTPSRRRSRPGWRRDPGTRGDALGTGHHRSMPVLVSKGEWRERRDEKAEW